MIFIFKNNFFFNWSIIALCRIQPSVSVLFNAIVKSTHSETDSLGSNPGFPIGTLCTLSCLGCVQLCNPMDCSPPGSFASEILQARILECVAVSSSRGSSRPRRVSCNSSIASGFFTTEPAGKAFMSSVQFSSFTQSCLTLCDPMNHSMPGLPVHHQLPESTQTHVH